MRVRALAVIVTIAGLMATFSAGEARAGGNWLGVRRDDGVPGGAWTTWSGPYVPGTSLEVRTTIYAKSHRFGDRLRTSGPYYAWFSPDHGRVDVSGLRPGAVRLSVLEVRWTSSQFAVVHGSFVVPSSPSGRYTIEVCNDPCTLSGFGQFVQGFTGVVQSSEAAHLVRQQDRLRSTLAATRRAAERSSRAAAARLSDAEAARASAIASVAVLTDQLDSARRRAAATAATDPRPVVAPWVGVMLAAAIASLAAATVIRRRRQAIVIPDTGEELLRRIERDERAATRSVPR
jgi:hypothetical protein